MRLERQVLGAIIKSREAWDKINEHLSDKDFSPEGGLILGYIRDYYDNDSNANDCDVQLLLSRVKREIQSNKLADLVGSFLTNLGTSSVSSGNVVEEFLALKRSALSNKIASKLATGKYDPSVKELMNEFLLLDEGIGKSAERELGCLVGVKATDLTVKSFNKEGLIQLYPLSLNEQIDGGIRGGHHVVVFAPTEMGKTLFVINACYGFLRQGLRILYIGNEDPASDILMRMMSRLTGMTKYDIIENPERADHILAGRNWENFVLASLAPGTFSKIERLVKEYKSQIVILDQLRNIDVSVDQRTQALEKAATSARNLGKRFDIPIISVMQASDSATGQLILTRGDIDGSNVGVPGQSDLMVGLGATDEMEERGLRMISLVKNKLSGRHQPISIQIDPMLSRIVE